MGNIRPPEFGVKKDENTLTTQDPNSVLYVVTPDDKWIPAKADDEGRLELGAVTLDMSDIQIGAVEIKDHTTDDRVHVTPIEFAIRTEARLHDGAGTDLTSTLIGGDQALDINIVGFGGGVMTEADDDDIADSLIRPTNITLSYAYDTGNTRWERLNQTGGSLDVNITGGASSGPTDTDDDAVAGAQLANLGIGLNYGWDGVDWARINATSGSLDVNITGGSSSGPTDTDDDAVAGGQLAALGIGLNYGWDGADWERINSTSGSLDVNITGGSSGGPTDTDDGSIAAGQVVGLSTGINYGYNGVTWERLLSTSGALHVDGSAVTQPISAASLPLPTGAATETTLATMLTEATFLAEDFATETTLAGIKTQTDLLTFSATRLLVDGSGVIQPISVATLPLPTGAATEATLAALNTKIVTDADDNSIADSQTLPLSIGLGYGYNGATWERLNSTSGALDVNIASGLSSPTDTDDGSIAGAQIVGLSTGLNYGWSGAAWERLNSTSGSLDANVTNTVTTDLTDDTTREVGRVLASDNLYVSETYGTTDSLAQARPVNGDFAVRHYKTKTIFIQNSGGVNDAIVEITGSVDGTTLDVPLIPAFTVKANETSITEFENALTHIRVTARAKTAGNQTTVVTKAYVLGV